MCKWRIANLDFGINYIHFLGGKGYSSIKRAPAYTFGQQMPVSFNKPVLMGTAPMLHTCGMGPKGKSIVCIFP